MEMFTEVKLVSSTYAAENGRFGGGVEVYNTRSGTNKFHGTGAYNFRRHWLNAAGYAVNSNTNNPPGFRPESRFNTAGGGAGGPVWIPKVYDGRNKTFFYATWFRDFRPNAPSSTTSSVATALMKAGDFTEVLGNGQVIYDPLTTAGNVRDPFPNQQIPTSRFSSVSRNILPFIPDPNIGGTSNNLQFLNQSPLNNIIWSMKFDHYVTDNFRVSYFHTQENNTTDSITALPGPLSQVCMIPAPSRGTSASTATGPSRPPCCCTPLSATRSGVRFGPTRLQQGFASQIGLPASTDATPRVSFAAADDLTPFGVQDGKVNDGFQNNRTWHINANMSIVKGKHEFKFGGDVRYLATIAVDAAGTNGQYLFERAQTALPTDRGGTGHSFASFLLGSPDSANTNVLPVPDTQIRYRYFSGFFQDNWKLTPRFTLNLGMRYEVPIGWYMANYQYSTFDPNLTNPAVGLPGAMTFPGPGAGRFGKARNYPTDFSNVGPRAGFSWRVAENTVVRGGIGIYYQTLGNGGCGCTLGFAGIPAQVISDGLNPAIQWDNGIPVPSDLARPPFIDPTIGNGLNVDYLGPNFGKAPRYENWSISLQHTIKKFLIDVGYLGNRGQYLNSSLPYNQVDPKYLTLGPLLGMHINSPEVQAAGFSEPYAGFADDFGSSATLAQSLRPYPQFLNVTERNSGDGRIWYDAFQTKVERRFGNVQFNANYTYSKSQARMHWRQIFTQSQTYPQNAYSLKSEKTISGFDVPHKFNFLGFFDLPFGKGKRFFSSASRGTELALGGWQLGLIMEYFSGPVIGATAPNTLGNGVLFSQAKYLNPTGTPILSGVNRTDLDPADPNTRWFNPGSFVAPGTYEFGYSSRYLRNFRQPPLYRENFSIVKNFNIFERGDQPVRVTWRADFFNLFNRTNFRVQGNPLNANFGRATGPGQGGRIITMGIRATF
ncbi:MAG: TonB-dependent receptor [Bryobacterales bacterium]